MSTTFADPTQFSRAFKIYQNKLSSICICATYTKATTWLWTHKWHCTKLSVV